MTLLYAKSEGGVDPHELVIDVNPAALEARHAEDWTPIVDRTGRRYEVRAADCEREGCRCAAELRRVDG
jgi:hypothetical protein